MDPVLAKVLRPHQREVSRLCCAHLHLVNLYVCVLGEGLYCMAINYVNVCMQGVGGCIHVDIYVCIPSHPLTGSTPCTGFSSCHNSACKTELSIT